MSKSQYVKRSMKWARVSGMILAASLLGACNGSGGSGSSAMETNVEYSVSQGDQVVTTSVEAARITVRHQLVDDQRYVTLQSGTADLLGEGVRYSVDASDP